METDRHNAAGEAPGGIYKLPSVFIYKIRHYAGPGPTRPELFGLNFLPHCPEIGFCLVGSVNGMKRQRSFIAKNAADSALYCFYCFGASPDVVHQHGKGQNLFSSSDIA